MSKQMTPCEKLGYKVGDKFEVISHHAFKKGQVVTLHEDDGTECPLFAGDGGGAGVFDGVECSFATLNQHVRKIANKLKPAKQALADAIHQNGGWMHGAEYAAQDKCAQVTMFRSKPIRHGNTWLDDEGFDDVGGFGCDKIQNWHQTILSRDEYLTAYPDQVKVEVNNETEHKVEFEMESESEMTIKVSDWHKNGELPPVGEVCIFDPNGRTEFFDEKAINAIGKEVSIISHVKFNGAVGSVAVFMCDTGGVATVCTANQDCFRPLRTEREKAIDEMVDCLSSRWANCEEIAAHLYENGYRKEAN